MDSDEDFLDSESAFKLEMDVEGLMSVVRSTEDSVVTEVGDRWMAMVWYFWFVQKKMMVNNNTAGIVVYGVLLVQ